MYARHCGIPNYTFSLTIKKACLKNKGGYSEQTLCSAWLYQQGHQCLPSPGGPLRKGLSGSARTGWADANGHCLDRRSGLNRL